MKKSLLAFITSACLLINGLYAQQLHNHRTCATVEYNQRLMEKDPNFAQKQKEWAKKMEKISANPTKKRGTVYVIPTVFHIVYKNAGEQLTMADVQSQLDVMNKDFRKLNTDASSVPAPFQSVAADFEIEFCLAQKDPQGNPTTGVTFTSTANQGFSINSDDIKFTAQGGIDAWPADTYFNIWVGDIDAGILGYAQFPGGSASTDGVVCDFTCFGSLGSTGQLDPTYNLGRTITHEAGHWLGLKHIWGDDSGACSGSDNIADTPNQADQNFGCPTFPLTDACTSTAPGVMFMNYMDYTDDACMYMFTEGQKAVSRALLDPGGTRASLLTNAATLCSIVPPPPPVTLDAGLSGLTPSGASCLNTVSPSFMMSNAQNSDSVLHVVILSYTINGGAAQTYTWTGNLNQGSSTTITLPSIVLPLGANTLGVQVTSVNGITDANAANNVTTTNITVLNSAPGVTPPYSEGFENNNMGLLAINNPNGGITWQIASGPASLGTKSVKIANYINTTYNDVDEISLPDINLTATNYPILSFDYAYASLVLNYSDTLEVLISNDCGGSFQTLGKFFNNTLNTVPFTTTQFVPGSKNEWKKRTFNLSAYNGNPALKIKLRNISTFQNNLYLDNINVYDAISAIEPQNELANMVSFLPNPANQQLQIHYEGTTDDVLKVELFDISGRVVYQENMAVKTGSNDRFINLEAISSGVYMLSFEQGNQRYTQKLMIAK